jgi:hypothetical protein
LYRVSAVPLLGGGMDQGKLLAGYHFPGAKAPTLQFIALPEAILPLTDALRSAAEQGSAVMRGKAPAAPVVASAAASAPSSNGQVADASRTPTQERLADLYKRQMTLASLATMSPEQEREYGEVVAEIAQASAAVEGEKLGAQHV